MSRAGKSKVIFQLRGGLGNQLFQYAIGRQVSLRLGVPLLLDSRDYKKAHGSTRPLLLSQFNIVAEISPRGDFPLWQRDHHLWRFGAALYRIRHPMIVENPMVHDTRVLHAKQATYFKGFWQQEAYFSEIADSLRDELTLRVPPSPVNQAMLDKIQSVNSVAVHVRRGDYRTDKNFALCSMGYYSRAAELVAERTNQALTFFIFSDEPEWASANLKLPGKMHLVNFNSDANSYEDLRLMSACRHNIIANSTFSWWGAWLNQNAGKIVVAPKTWYHSPELSNEHINASNFIVMDNLQP